MLKTRDSLGSDEYTRERRHAFRRKPSRSSTRPPAQADHLVTGKNL